VSIHELAGEYIRLAWETGRSWLEIGEALDLIPYAAANKVSVGEEAHDYAFRYHRGPGRPTFTWTCPACLQTITDPTPIRPTDREAGHEDNCPRRAAELAAVWRRHILDPASFISRTLGELKVGEQVSGVVGDTRQGQVDQAGAGGGGGAGAVAKIMALRSWRVVREIFTRCPSHR
jgi:hypothetical protein